MSNDEINVFEQVWAVIMRIFYQVLDWFRGYKKENDETWTDTIPNVTDPDGKYYKG